MLWQALTSVRDIGRLHDIASVLIRYGFSDIVRRIGLVSALERAGLALHWRAYAWHAQLCALGRLRRAVGLFGPSLVPPGPRAPSRAALHEPAWIAEFGTLQDRAPAVPYDKVREQLVAALGA